MDIWPADIARHMDVSRSAYHQWEKGMTRPKDIDSYRRLALYLEVGLEDLGVDIGEMAPSRRTFPAEEGTHRPHKPATGPKRRSAR